jgi:hypothetical protein
VHDVDFALVLTIGIVVLVVLLSFVGDFYSRNHHSIRIYVLDRGPSETTVATISRSSASCQERFPPGLIGFEENRRVGNRCTRQSVLSRVRCAIKGEAACRRTFRPTN